MGDTVCERPQAWTNSSAVAQKGEEMPSLDESVHTMASLTAENKMLSEAVAELSKRVTSLEQRQSHKIVESEPKSQMCAVVAEKGITEGEVVVGHEAVKHDFKSALNGMRHMITDSWMNLLLLAVPFALASSVWPPVVSFVLCLVAIIPLAGLLGSATEELSLYTSQTVGGLLNATFGNAVELIVGIVALKDGLLRVVQANMLGSILSNLLLVLGMSFVAAGIKNKSSKFNSTAAQASSSLLLLAVMALIVPAALFLTGTEESTHETAVLNVSRFTAIIMLLMYICFLVFQLKTHVHLFVDAEGDEEAEQPKLPVWAAAFMLLAVTVVVAVVAEILVASIEDVTKAWGISETFVGLIMLPLVGNAAEHLTAVTVAYKDKMNLAIGVAVGSSLQIALMVMPLLVLIGWMIQQPLTFNFLGFETVVSMISVVIVNAVIQDGESTWLEGALLISAYVILAASFFYGE